VTNVAETGNAIYSLELLGPEPMLLALKCESYTFILEKQIEIYDRKFEIVKDETEECKLQLQKYQRSIESLLIISVVL